MQNNLMKDDILLSRLNILVLGILLILISMRAGIHPVRWPEYFITCVVRIFYPIFRKLTLIGLALSVIPLGVILHCLLLLLLIGCRSWSPVAVGLSLRIMLLARPPLKCTEAD